jgi:hypothetical protein
MSTILDYTPAVVDVGVTGCGCGCDTLAHEEMQYAKAIARSRSKWLEVPVVDYR